MLVNVVEEDEHDGGGVMDASELFELLNITDECLLFLRLELHAFN